MADVGEEPPERSSERHPSHPPVARRDLADGVCVVARLAAGPEVTPDQPEIGPLRDGLDVVDNVRRGQQTFLQTPPAKRISSQLRKPQLPPGRVIPARRGRAAPAIELQTPLRHAADRRLMHRRTVRHRA